LLQSGYHRPSRASAVRFRARRTCPRSRTYHGLTLVHTADLPLLSSPSSRIRIQRRLTPVHTVDLPLLSSTLPRICIRAAFPTIPATHLTTTDTGTLEDHPLNPYTRSTMVERRWVAVVLTALGKGQTDLRRTWVRRVAGLLNGIGSSARYFTVQFGTAAAHFADYAHATAHSCSSFVTDLCISTLWYYPYTLRSIYSNWMCPSRGTSGPRTPLWILSSQDQ